MDMIIQYSEHRDTGREQQSPKVDRSSSMKYFKEERLVIDQRIYDGEISRRDAMEEYGIGEQTARDYMRLCRTLKKQLWA